MGERGERREKEGTREEEREKGGGEVRPCGLCHDRTCLSPGPDFESGS